MQYFILLFVNLTCFVFFCLFLFYSFLVCYCKLGKISNIFEMIEAVGCIDMSSLQYVRGMISSSVSESDSNSVSCCFCALVYVRGCSVLVFIGKLHEGKMHYSVYQILV